MNLQDVFEQIDAVDRDVVFKRGQKDSVAKIIADKERQLKKDEQAVAHMEQAVQFLTTTSKVARDRTNQAIEGLATANSQVIYDKPVKIVLKYKEKSRSDASDRMEIFKVIDSMAGPIETALTTETNSGGLCESSAISLRMSGIKWLGYKGPVMFDEAYRSMSNDDKLDRVVAVVKAMADSTGNQILLSTHKRAEFAPIADRIFHVSVDPETENSSVEVVV